MMRAEQSNPTTIISTHNLIENDPQLKLRYLAAQEQAITHFEDMFKLLWDDNIQACLKIWDTSPYILKIKEYQSPQRMREVMEKTPMYKKSM